MNLVLSLSELSKELEAGRRDSRKAYRLYYITREVAGEVALMQPDGEYVRDNIIPLFKAAAEAIKISSPKGGFSNYVGGFLNSIRERIKYLQKYEPIMNL